MKIIISSFGSSGDFNPCLGLGRALRQRGVDVVFLSNPYYEKKIIQAGLRFCPAGEYWDVFKTIRENPDFLHPRKGPRAVWNLVLRTVPVMYAAMKDLINQEKPNVVACHILEYGGMLAAIERGVPYTTLSPTPMGWFNTLQPGYLNNMELPIRIRRLLAKTIRIIMDFGFQYSLKPFCKARGIPNPIKRTDDVYGKACLNLGLWSPILRPGNAGDPPNSQICGFVRDEHVKDWPDVPEEIVDFFAHERRPVVVGLGSTASLHGDEIYQNTVKACKEINWPSLLIGHDLAKYQDRQKRILTVDFAPYGWVFPRAAFVIHHGGLNTTAETLRAGVPGLVVPHGYDQFDNAIRTQKMGMTQRMKVNKVTSKEFSLAIQSILNNPDMYQKAQEISGQLLSEPDGAEIAVQTIIDTVSNF